MRATRYSAFLIAGAALVTSFAGCKDASGPTSEVYTASFSSVGVAAPGERCLALTVSIAGPGTSTPGGALTTVQSHCINPAGANPLLFDGGVYTFTYSGGRSITGTYSGTMVPTASPTVFALDGAFTITGGTGEFAGATGGGDASGTTDVVSGAATLNLAGTLVR